MLDFEEGEILYFDKPYGWTSFSVVKTVRHFICKRLGLPQRGLKVGHAGTLDPLATGVMTICTGRATKKIESLQHQTKEYVATLRLGATTPSFDMEHEVDRTYPTEHITRELVERVLRQFVGTIEQVPPAYSACNVNGKRAYLRARKGEEVELKPKTLVIDDIELLDYDMPSVTIRVTCSKGTYIRALARDIGEALGSGAYLTGLRRTRVGDVTVDRCQRPEDFGQWIGVQEVAPRRDRETGKDGTVAGTDGTGTGKEDTETRKDNI